MIVTAWVLLIMFGLFSLSDLNLTEDETKHIKFFIIMKFVSVFIAAVAAGVCNLGRIVSMKNVKTIGLHIEGALFNEDGTEFTYDDFIKIIESNGIEFCGQTCVITDEGKLLDETGKEIDKDKCKTFKEELDHMIKIKNILF